ncbi:hypothetical protein [Nocardia sp. IFM 10818]
MNDLPTCSALPGVRPWTGKTTGSSHDRIASRALRAVRRMDGSCRLSSAGRSEDAARTPEEDQ